MNLAEFLVQCWLKPQGGRERVLLALHYNAHTALFSSSLRTSNGVYKLMFVADSWQQQCISPHLRRIKSLNRKVSLFRLRMLLARELLKAALMNGGCYKREFTCNENTLFSRFSLAANTACVVVWS